MGFGMTVASQLRSLCPSTGGINKLVCGEDRVFWKPSAASRLRRVKGGGGES